MKVAAATSTSTPSPTAKGLNPARMRLQLQGKPNASKGQEKSPVERLVRSWALTSVKKPTVFRDDRSRNPRTNLGNLDQRKAPLFSIFA